MLPCDIVPANEVMMLYKDEKHYYDNAMFEADFGAYEN